MTRIPPADELLLKALLRQVDRTQPESSSEPGDALDSGTPDRSHLDDELLTLFVEGALTEPERAGVVRHLADCAGCRQVASALLRLAGEDLPQTRPHRAASRIPKATAWVTAATVLAAAGIWFFATDQGQRIAERKTYRETRTLLAQADFNQAQAALAEAAMRGIHSDRLYSLQAQAALGIPHARALAAAGRLSDFGYEAGGIIPRGPKDQQTLAKLKAAREILAQAGSTDLDAVLNRGHVLLSLGQPVEASAEFQTAVRLDPREPLGWLGLGLADYMREDYAAAEKAFRAALLLDPGSLAAQINLAMTLEEREQWPAAWSAWQTLLKQGLSAADREKVQQAILQLQEQMQQ